MINQIHKDLKAKKYSVVELTKQYVNSIEEKDRDLNAFITVTKNEALKQAESLDLELTSGDIDSLFNDKPLFGIPIAHKDIYSTKGIETTAASNILKGYIPPYDATVVKRYYDAGAVLVGKLNCDAFAHGGSGQNSDFGHTKNPYDLSVIPGGSSSGSAVAVASDMTVIGTGSDTGGSIRLPASFTNTVGLKPTYGRVSRYGIISMASSTDSVGHITRTVEDNARVLSVTAGHDVHDGTTSKTKPEHYLGALKNGVSGMRIGVALEYFSDIDTEIAESVQSSLAILEKKGAEIVDIDMPHTKYALAVYYIVQPSEVSSNLGRFDGIRYGHSRLEFGPEAKRRIMMGTYTLSSGYYDAYYLKAQKVRTLIKQDFDNAFEQVDVLIAPVSPIMPPKLGENTNDPLKMYMMDVLSVTANLAGIPGLAVPSGFSKSGLPIGLQILGKQYDEATLYAVGNALEQEQRLFEKRPEL